MTSRPFAEVIGDPIEQSRSPDIHGFWLKQLGIDADYVRTRVGRGELAGHIATRRADAAWRGSNVTMPLKLDALGLADAPTDRAVAAGAANALFLRDGKLVAANTDVGAIALLLGRLRDQGAAMGSLTLFGNGGAARAALVACRLAGIGNVVIQARDLTAATALAVQFGLDEQPRPLTSPVETDGLINATPLGMPGMDCLNCDVSRLPAKGWVFDLVTVTSPLIEAARARGLAAVDGLEMLVEQAASSFKLFFGVDAPRDRDADLMRELRA